MGRFYKYVSVEVAKIILTESTLKFSNPVKFNDPFDYHPYVPDKGLSKFIRRINNTVGNGFKQYRTNHHHTQKHLQDLRKGEFRETYTKNMSISCFSKSPYILPMWAHYANNHEGCVIEFNYKNDKDFIESYFSLGIGQLSSILLPLDVIYSKDRPPLFDKEGKTDTSNTGFNACLTKAKEWEYEQEMRVITLQPEGIYSFDRTQITGIYFGMRTDSKHKKNLSNTVDRSNNYTGTKIKKYDMQMAFDKFELFKVPYRS